LQLFGKNMTIITRLLTVAALFVLPAAWAETLSSNLGANVYFTEPVGGATWIGAGFSTGPTTYTLDAATLLMQEDLPGSVALDLYSDVSGRPGSLLGSLTSPSNFSSTLTSTEFTGTNLTLVANSAYWLVLQSKGGEYEWAYTDNNTGSGPGFAGTWGASDNAGASWLVSDIDPMIMQVDASPADLGEPTTVPEPAGILLFGGGILALATFYFYQRCDRKGA
jgi:hypothetical protein